MGKPRKRAQARLSVPQYMRCCDWLRDNWATVEEKRPSRFQLCGMMCEALGFRVPDSSLSKVLEAIDKTLPAAAPKPAADENGFLRKTDRVRILCRVVRELYTRLGETPPPVLDKLIIGYSMARQDKELAADETEVRPVPDAIRQATDKLVKDARELEAAFTGAKSRTEGLQKAAPRQPSATELGQAKDKLQRLSAELHNCNQLSKQSLLRNLDQHSLNTLRKANELDNQLVIALSNGVAVTERHLRGGL